MGRDLAPLPARHLRAQPGDGIAGEIDVDTVATGSAAFMARLGWSVPPPLLPGDDDNLTAVFVGWTGAVRGLLLLDDTPLAEAPAVVARSEEHTYELQSPMRISYAVFCLKKKTNDTTHDMSPQRYNEI